MGSGTNFLQFVLHAGSTFRGFSGKTPGQKRRQQSLIKPGAIAGFDVMVADGCVFHANYSSCRIITRAQLRVRNNRILAI